MTGTTIMICVMMVLVIFAAIVVVALSEKRKQSSNIARTPATSRTTIAPLTAAMGFTIKNTTDGSTATVKQLKPQRIKMVRVCRLPMYYFKLSTQEKSVFLSFVLSNYYGPGVDLNKVTRGYQELPSGSWVIAEARERLCTNK